MPAGLCIYWISNSLLGMVQEIISGRMLRKDYEAAQKEMEEQKQKAKEAEKERRRKSAEKKAAALAAGKSGKKQPQPKKKGADVSASREGLRTYARGRAYDPNRYPITPYHDPNGPARPVVEEEPEEPAGDGTPGPSQPGQAPGSGAPLPPTLTPTPPRRQSSLEPTEEEDGDYEEAYSEDETPDDKE